jgi:hypothetical protein
VEHGTQGDKQEKALHYGLAKKNQHPPSHHGVDMKQYFQSSPDLQLTIVINYLLTIHMQLSIK